MGISQRFIDRVGRWAPALSARCRRSLCFVALLAVIAAGWGVAAWLLAEKVTAERVSRLVERERTADATAAAAIDNKIQLMLAHASSIPKVLSRQPDIVGILSRYRQVGAKQRLTQQSLRDFLAGVPKLVRLSERLASMSAELPIDQVWVMNADGDCIASGGFPPEATATGVNYADREYFLMARKAGGGRQFAVGRTTNIPGIYYSAAVAGDRFLGAVVVKVNVARISPLIAGENVFVTDENDVIIIPGESAFFMKAVPEAKVDELPAGVAFGRYKRHRFDRIEITPAEVAGESMFRLEGRERPMLLKRRSNSTDRLSVWMLSDVPQVWEAMDEERWLFVLLFLSGNSLFAGVAAGLVYLHRRRQHQAEMARINERLASLNDELLQQARFDALTGCANRRYFLEVLGVELSRTARFAYPCCLAMLDIDHFKQVNDRHGHAAGDALLERFSRIARNCLRSSSDILGRLGGEEFALPLRSEAQGDVAQARRCAIDGGCRQASRRAGAGGLHRQPRIFSRRL